MSEVTDVVNLCRFGVVHRRELWASRRQPAAAFGDGEAAPIDGDRESAVVRNRPGDNKSAGEHGNRNRDRRGERRHTGPGVGPELRENVGEHQRGAVLSREQHHPRDCWQRSDNLERRGPREPDAAGDPERAGRAGGGLSRRQDQGVDGALDGGSEGLGASLRRKVPP